MIGGPPQADLSVENVRLGCLGEDDLPEDNIIFGPYKTKEEIDCSDNILLIGGKLAYKSRYLRELFGGVFSEAMLDVRAPNKDGNGYTIINYNHDGKESVIAQRFENRCFEGSNYFIRIEANVEMSNKLFRLSDTSCSDNITHSHRHL